MNVAGKIALLAEEAGVSDDELATITLVEFSARLRAARAAKAREAWKLWHFDGVSPRGVSPRGVA